MNAVEVQELLRKEVLKAGGVTAWSAAKGVDQGSVSRALAGARPPSSAIVAALGLVRRIDYVRPK